MTNKIGIVTFTPNKKIGYIFVGLNCPLFESCSECGGKSGINIQLPDKFNDIRYEGMIAYIDHEGKLSFMEDPDLGG